MRPPRRSASAPARRGVALLAALWLVVAIGFVGVSFADSARERRVLGLELADHARDRALLSGALARLHAMLDLEERSRGVPRGRMDGRPSAAGDASRAGVTRADDPWGALTARFADGLVVGEERVRVAVLDLGTVRNVNVLSEVSLQQLLAAVLRDAVAARALSQAIVDWRDVDDSRRLRGAEREAYLAEEADVLPTNGAMREIDDLRHVRGVDDDVLEQLRPHLTTDGPLVPVNINAAPEAVLRSIPGMTPALLAQIVTLRSGGRRILSLAALAASARGGSPRGEVDAATLTRRLAQLTTLETREILVELTVRGAGNGAPSRLRAVLRRAPGESVRVVSVR